jgi:hypothetical protein
MSTIRVRLAFDAASGLTTAGQLAAVAEAAQVWKPYGVLVYAGSADNCDADLTVTADRASRRDASLGSVRFGADGIPDSHIDVRYDAVVQLAIGTGAFGMAAREWPVRLRDEVIARAVGRTLAHEIGHYVLQSPHHAKSGLMRQRQRAAALASPDRTGFALTPSDVARLHIVMAAGVLAERRDRAASTLTTASTCAIEQRADASDLRAQ